MLSYDQPAAAIWVSYLSTQINAIFPFVQDTKVPVKTSNLCFLQISRACVHHFCKTRRKKIRKYHFQSLKQKHSLVSALVNMYKPEK